MTVAFDAASESHTGTTGSVSEASFSWSHDPVGTPKGVLVFTFCTANANPATAVTYGGTALTAVAGGRALDTAGEPGDCKAWFLGSSVPTSDPATVVVTRTNDTTTVWAMAVTVTAATDTQLSGTPVLLENDGTLAEQNVDSGSASALRFAGLGSGLASVPAAGANSTLLSADIDFGNRVMCAVRETTAGSGSRPVGFSSVTSDDRAGVHLAIAETSTSTDLVIQDAVHAHTAESLALTQVHELAIQDAAHGQTSDNLALAVVHQLAISDGFHTHTAEGIVLTQDHTLVIQDAVHGHTAESPVLEEVHQLVIQDAVHGHAAESLTLGTTHNLTIHDALHLHVVDNITLVHHVIWLPTFRRTTVATFRRTTSVGTRTIGQGTYGEGTYGGTDWESAEGTNRRESVVTLRRG